MRWLSIASQAFAFYAILLPAIAQEKSDRVLNAEAPSTSVPAELPETQGVQPKATIVAGPKAAWDVSCKPDTEGTRMACVMSQVLTLVDTKTRLLRVEILPPKMIGNANALIKLSLPHGILIQPGAEIRVDDGQAFRVPFQISDSDGIYTTQSLGTDLIASMKRGSKLFVSVVLSDGRKREIPASLAGFSLAYSKIVE